MDKSQLPWWFCLSDWGCEILGSLSFKQAQEGSTLISFVNTLGLPSLSPLKKPSLSAHHPVVAP